MNLVIGVAIRIRVVVVVIVVDTSTENTKKQSVKRKSGTWAKMNRRM